MLHEFNKELERFEANFEDVFIDLEASMETSLTRLMHVAAAGRRHACRSGWQYARY